MQKHASVKEKLLMILKKDYECTMRELMVYFDISEVAVRRHLRELENQGFIMKEEVKQEIGRPYYVYRLTKKGHQTFPNQYEQLPVELLEDLEEVQGKEAVKEVLDRRMEREKAYYQERLTSDNFDEKIAEIARLQDKKGYMIEYEKTPEGDYKVTNYNCPILNVASKYARLCHNEKKVLGALFPNSRVLSQTCITRGDHYCQWIITKPKEKAQIDQL